MVDRATFETAEKYDDLKTLLERATIAQRDEVKAEEARRLAAGKKIADLGQIVIQTRSKLGAAGQARQEIEQAIPAEIGAALDKARLALAPHKGALEEMKRRHAHQKDHADKTSEKLDPKLPADKFQIAQLEKAVSAAAGRVEEEEERCEKLEESLARASKARDSFVLELRKKLFSTVPKEKAPANAK